MVVCDYRDLMNDAIPYLVNACSAATINGLQIAMSDVSTSQVDELSECTSADVDQQQNPGHLRPSKRKACRHTGKHSRSGQPL